MTDYYNDEDYYIDEDDAEIGISYYRSDITDNEEADEDTCKHVLVFASDQLISDDASLFHHRCTKCGEQGITAEKHIYTYEQLVADITR